MLSACRLLRLLRPLDRQTAAAATPRRSLEKPLGILRRTKSRTQMSCMPSCDHLLSRHALPGRILVAVGEPIAGTLLGNQSKEVRRFACSQSAAVTLDLGHTLRQPLSKRTQGACRGQSQNACLVIPTPASPTAAQRHPSSLQFKAPTNTQHALYTQAWHAGSCRTTLPSCMLERRKRTTGGISLGPSLAIRRDKTGLKAFTATEIHPAQGIDA